MCGPPHARRVVRRRTLNRLARTRHGNVRGASNVEAEVVEIVVAWHGVKISKTAVSRRPSIVPSRRTAQIGFLLEAGRDESAATVAGQTVGRDSAVPVVDRVRTRPRIVSLNRAVPSSRAAAMRA